MDIIVVRRKIWKVVTALPKTNKLHILERISFMSGITVKNRICDVLHIYLHNVKNLLCSIPFFVHLTSFSPFAALFAPSSILHSLDIQP